MLNNISEGKQRRRNASCASRSGTISRKKIEDYISPTMHQEKDHSKVVGARSEDDKVCACLVDKHTGRGMPE